MKMMGMKSFTFPDEILKPCFVGALINFHTELKESPERSVKDIALECVLNSIANAYRQMFDKFIGTSLEISEASIAEACGSSAAPILIGCTTASFRACIDESTIPSEKEELFQWIKETGSSAFAKSANGICLTIELWKRDDTPKLVPILSGCRYHLDESSRIVKDDEIFSGVIEQEISSPLLPLVELTVHYKINLQEEISK